MRKKIIYSLFVFIFVGAAFYYFYTNYYMPYNLYNTIGGVSVSVKNIETLVPKAPADVVNNVHFLFEVYSEAYDTLVKQHDLLTEVGNCASDCASFFTNHPELKNIGGINYIFKVPSEDFLVKISGPSTRLYNTAMHMGLGMKIAYFRRVYKPGMQQGKTFCRYMSFDEDKKLIEKYFRMCVPRMFLQEKPTRNQLRKLAYMVCGSLAHFGLSGRADCRIEETFLNNLDYCPKTIQQALSDFLDCAFDAIQSFCYQKSDLVGKAFADTYNVASRVFHMARFNEAIDVFRLDRLARPPMGYIVHVNPQKPYSCSDRDVVFVQQMVKDFKTVQFYISSDKKQVYDQLFQVFDDEAIRQLCKAIQYSGLWDINGDNILINEKTKKIMYIDFEHNRDVTPNQLFNGSKEKVQNNVCEAIVGLLKLFRSFRAQKLAIHAFVKENDIDLESYVQAPLVNIGKTTKRYNNFSPLGWLLCYEDTSSQRCQKLKQVVCQQLKNAA